jgi:hypothetical protein
MNKQKSPFFPLSFLEEEELEDEEQEFDPAYAPQTDGYYETTSGQSYCFFNRWSDQPVGVSRKWWEEREERTRWDE